MIADSQQDNDEIAILNLNNLLEIQSVHKFRPANECMIQTVFAVLT